MWGGHGLHRGRGMNVSTRCLQIYVCSALLQICMCCSEDDERDDTVCWYTLWYIWFVLGLFLVVFSVLVILYIKHKTKERSRVRRLQRNHRTMPIPVVAPQQPPSYTEASHKPPSYTEAMQHPQLVTVRAGNEVARSIFNPRTHTSGRGMTGGMVGGLPGVADDYASRPPPTSLDMLSAQQVRPPSYRTSISHQGHPT